MCLHSKNHICTLLDGICPSVKVLMQTPMSIHIHAPMMGFPHSETNLRSSADGMCPHSEDRFCKLINGMCPRVEALTQTCLQAFLDCPMRVETLRCGIFPHLESRSTTGISPLRTFDLPRWEVPPLRRSSLYTPWQDVPPRGGVNAEMPMGLSRSSYGSRNPLLWDFPHSESPTLLQEFPSQSPRLFF